MIPLRDENPTRLMPLLTVGVIGLNLASWLLVQGAGTSPDLVRSICEYGLIPGEFLGRVPHGASVQLGPETTCVLGSGSNLATLVTPLTSMFMHGGWLHLAGNVLFLWIFGNNIEDAMGHGRFIAYYLLCGFAAVAAQALTSPESVVPMVGASGAIAGVMGGYLILYPRARIQTLIFLGFYITLVWLPAWLMLLYWFGLQILGSLVGAGAGVAFLAHVGGFVAGVALIKLFARPGASAAGRRRTIEIERWR